MIFDKDMEDLSDLIFDPDSDMFEVAPSASLKDMENIILDGSKEIEVTSIGDMEPMPQFDNLKAHIMIDLESTTRNEKKK